jgi:hypothetical protein
VTGSERDRGCVLTGLREWSLCYFFFGFALLLVDGFAFADGLSFLPDRHPQVLHILVPFQKGLGLAH